MGRTQALT